MPSPVADRATWGPHGEALSNWSPWCCRSFSSHRAWLGSGCGTRSIPSASSSQSTTTWISEAPASPTQPSRERKACEELRCRAQMQPRSLPGTPGKGPSISLGGQAGTRRSGSSISQQPPARRCKAPAAAKSDQVKPAHRSSFCISASTAGAREAWGARAVCWESEGRQVPPQGRTRGCGSLWQQSVWLCTQVERWI